ncbi:MAG TPA: poly-gamma-glutamate biosynthesis protein PgsC/CapC [Polyangiaceae bacterium]|nr:poly-gamma-glutamate biosynthesis protein PgsC/CapC [Polyangiaceae bacterium]
MDSIALFPSNGLDRSLHAAVLVGLALNTFFTEALGWTFAGLVVPGYLATVFIAAPVTGVLVAIEAMITYALVALVGQWITKTGAWSTAFGRERFYLFIVGAVLVRLAVEGSVIPYLATKYNFVHSRELYSLGLVLVPLVANTFWNSGLRHAAPRLALMTALTWVIVLALINTTNLSVARFQVVNESVSVKFLESPKAYIILVIGALLGARDNVRYGWDYNGILVPGLLAVAWYDPLKVVTTAIEALLVYGLAAGLMKVPPFSRMLIVGPRRTLFAYVVGFGLKMILGFIVARAAPGAQMIDFFGFGYLLPTLLAVKMWNRENIGVVLMPTLQVSLVAFGVGNILGYTLAMVSTTGVPAAQAAQTPAPLPRSTSAAWELILGDSGQRPSIRPGHTAGSHDAALTVVREVTARGEVSVAAMSGAERASLRVADGGGGWVTVAPQGEDPHEGPLAPRAALRKALRKGSDGGFIVLATPSKVGSALPAVALKVAEALDASALVLVSRFAELSERDEAFAKEVAKIAGAQRVLFVEEGGSGRSELSVSGAVPEGLDVVKLGEIFGGDLALVFRAAAARSGALWKGAVELSVPEKVAEEAGAGWLGAPETAAWREGLRRELGARLAALTETGPGGFRGPSIQELRVFDARLAPRMLSVLIDPALKVDPSAWERAVAGKLGYAFVRVGDPGRSPEAWGLVEEGPDRRGNPSWFMRAEAPDRRERPEGVQIEVPAPRWEAGTFGAGLALFGAIEARGILIAGASPKADLMGTSDPRIHAGVRSFFQRAHEVWLGSNGEAISVQGMARGREVAADVVLSFGREVIEPEPLPAWTGPLVAVLGDAGLRYKVFDGTGESLPYSGASDAAMAYATRFARDRFTLLFLSPPLRAAFARWEQDRRLPARLARMDQAVGSVDVAARAMDLVACSARSPNAPASGLGGGPANACPAADVDPRLCDLDAAEAIFRSYVELQNPFDLRAAVLEGGQRCFVEVAEDARSGRLWATIGIPGQARLVPLGGPIGKATAAPIRSLAAARRAVALGAGSLRVEVGEAAEVTP